MSSIRLPSSHLTPYIDLTAFITVHVGPDPVTKFDVHKPLLSNASYYWRKHIRNNPGKDLHLPREDPRTFEEFLRYQMYGRTALEMQEEESPVEWYWRKDRMAAFADEYLVNRGLRDTLLRDYVRIGWWAMRAVLHW